MQRLTETESDLLRRIVEAVAEAPEAIHAPAYRTIVLKLSVPEVIALRKLRNSLNAPSRKPDLSPKHSELL